MNHALTLPVGHQTPFTPHRIGRATLEAGLIHARLSRVDPVLAERFLKDGTLLCGRQEPHLTLISLPGPAGRHIVLGLDFTGALCQFVRPGSSGQRDTEPTLPVGATFRKRAANTAALSETELLLLRTEYQLTPPLVAAPGTWLPRSRVLQPRSLRHRLGLAAGMVSSGSLLTLSVLTGVPLLHAVGVGMIAGLLGHEGVRELLRTGVRVRQHGTVRRLVRQERAELSSSGMPLALPGTTSLAETQATLIRLHPQLSSSVLAAVHLCRQLIQYPDDHDCKTTARHLLDALTMLSSEPGPIGPDTTRQLNDQITQTCSRGERQLLLARQQAEQRLIDRITDRLDPEHGSDPRY